MSSVKVAAVATWLAGLSVTGLTIKDLDAIKENMQVGDWPCLVPHPVNYLTGLGVVRDSFGRGQDVLTYTLNYRLYFRPVTGVVKFFGQYDELIDMVVLVINKIQDTKILSSIEDITPGISAVGGVEDAAGNVYHGCDFTFAIREFYETS